MDIVTGLWHWLIVLVILFALLPVWPAWRICRRAGYSGAWALTLLVPAVGIIFMWVFAFSRWPVLRKADQAIVKTFE